ncbi:hypothetical protein DERP_013412 [Dermatophagoides pteronyssinus]|nr:hypothetical protein DERP_013412 [Dermatophagoides pteronyssinus]
MLDYLDKSERKKDNRDEIPKTSKPPTSPRRSSPSNRSAKAKKSAPQTNNNNNNKTNKADQYRTTLLERRSKSILHTHGPLPAESSPTFQLYQFEQSKSNAVQIRSEFGEQIYRVKHRDFSQLPMVVRVYEKEQANQIRNPLYFRILRYLGKKHPSILQTWDVFQNINNQIFVFQQHTHIIDLTQYILGRQPDGEVESVVCQWSRQLCRVLEYLINSAVCHNNLTSSTVLISLRDKTSIQLTGFYRSFIYSANYRDNLRPPLPLRNRDTNRPDFKPPEVFGTEYQTVKYDPLVADMWSLGCIIYFALSGEYPYDYKIPPKNMEQDILGNLKYLSNRISKPGYEILASMLTTKINKRLKLEKMDQHLWFTVFKSDDVDTIITAKTKTLDETEMSTFTDFYDDECSAFSRFTFDSIPEPTARGRRRGGAPKSPTKDNFQDLNEKVKAVTTPVAPKMAPMITKQGPGFEKYEEPETERTEEDDVDIFTGDDDRTEVTDTFQRNQPDPQWQR